jgi:hypothetical protein
LLPDDLLELNYTVERLVYIATGDLDSAQYAIVVI